MHMRMRIDPPGRETEVVMYSTILKVKGGGLDSAFKRYNYMKLLLQRIVPAHMASQMCQNYNCNITTGKMIYAF